MSPDPVTFAAWNGAGRRFGYDDVVALGDADSAGRLRLDGVARLLQSVSVRDSDDAGFLDPWVLRRLAIAFDGTPSFGEPLRLDTWCSGAGAAVAERRTTITVTGGRGGVAMDRGARVEATALWVHIDPVSGAPAALPGRFAAVYGASAAGRHVRSRLTLEPPGTAGLEEIAWPLRSTDVDLVGHVHNTVYWAAIETARRAAWGDRPVTAATLEFRGGIDLEESVTVAWNRPDSDEIAVWMLVDDDVRAAARLQRA